MSNDKLIYDFFKNYQDRGMKKWTGFLLSDHIAQIAKSPKSESNSLKSSLNLEKIKKLLSTAILEGKIVQVQVKVVDLDGVPLPEIRGRVEAWDDNQVVINRQIINLAEINYLEIVKEL
ncbi:hypothetical protein [Lactobacillus mulieris]|uniref:DNA-directed RNA polymerase subunit beta n=1 Tax=Lactobacillus mulieris TaxID=2508708 RepID=A0AAW5WY11_9LACO|nr:hypothetical protein [Lactobacillus mulieris]MCZ3622192.1 hypothetical protein [Lactobacillus mulieris]MCZ3623889.1 hypothetical protein [Lactobacillus mulieris]MCZ3636199.1 hypothetical protein [Lactobacillus mulieris]MCZ3690188.1 hypothetical protein [Lactobacillus mulieris]MCZ3696269.1 hypothetical protein [Lactobacillus mulieris]